MTGLMGGETPAVLLVAWKPTPIVDTNTITSSGMNSGLDVVYTANYGDMIFHQGGWMISATRCVIPSTATSVSVSWNYNSTFEVGEAWCFGGAVLVPGETIPLPYALLNAVASEGAANVDQQFYGDVSIPTGKKFMVNGVGLVSDTAYTVTLDPNSMNATGDIETVLFTDTALGDEIIAIAPYDLQGIMVSTYVQSAGTCKVVFYKPSAGAVDLASGSWKLYQRKH